MNNKKITITGLLVWGVEILFAIFLFFPLIYILSTSIKTQQEYFKDPTGFFTSFSLENYIKTYEMGFVKYFYNSFMVVFMSMLLLVVLATMSSYALVRINFKINKILMVILVSGMMLPMHAAIIPTFILETKFGLYDTLLGVALPQLAFAIPISIFIVTQFVETIPVSIIESATIDGAGHYAIFAKIVSPLLKPAIVTIVIYNGVRIWNNFSFPLIFSQSKKNYTIPLGLQEFYGEFSINVPGILSAITICSLPILIVYFFLQEAIVKGLTGGAEKG